MNGQTYRWMEKESGRQSEEKRLIDKQMNGQIDRQIVRKRDIQGDEWTDGQTNRKKERQIDSLAERQTMDYKTNRQTG